MVGVERVPEPCGQGAVGSRLSFGRPLGCPSCQGSGLWEGSKNPHWTRTDRNCPAHTEVREIDCHPQGLKHRMASGRDWRNNLGTEVVGGSLWVPEAGRSSFGQRSSHFLLFCKSSALVDSEFCPTPRFDSSSVVSSCYISFAGTSIQTLQVHLVLHNGERNWGNHPSRSFLKRGREERP